MALLAHARTLASLIRCAELLATESLAMCLSRCRSLERHVSGADQRTPSFFKKARQQAPISSFPNGVRSTRDTIHDATSSSRSVATCCAVTKRCILLSCTRMWPRVIGMLRSAKSRAILSTRSSGPRAFKPTAQNLQRVNHAAFLRHPQACSSPDTDDHVTMIDHSILGAVLSRSPRDMPMPYSS